MVQNRKSENSSITDLLPGLVHDRGWEKQLDLHSVFVNWQAKVPEDVAKHALPLKIEKGVLWLEVENSSWMQQLQYQKLEMLEMLNGSLKVAQLKDIKMVLPKGRARETVTEKPVAISFVRPSKEKVAAFQKQVACIQDEKCREALMQFWYLAQACKRNKK